MAKQKKVGVAAPVINIVICLLLIGLVCVMLFGQVIIEKYLPKNEDGIPTGILTITENFRLNLSAIKGYLPKNDEGALKAISHYNIGGVEVEPLAIILQILLYVTIIGVALNIWRLVLLVGCIYKPARESVMVKISNLKAGVRVFNFILMVFAVGALGVFIYTYNTGVDANPNLFSDLQNFFAEVFSAGMVAWETRPEAGPMVVMVNYALIGALGIGSWVFSMVNR